jgi:hypothetical protein
MYWLFLVAFWLGLLTGVLAMFFGVERQGGERPAPVPGVGGIEGMRRTISARLNVPSVAAFATLFGATGYLLTRYTRLGPIGRVLIAAPVGVAGVVGAIALIAKWAVPSAMQEEVDERYLLQGHLALVTRAIGAGGRGEIRYDEGGASYMVPAASLEGIPLEEDTEVVIERIEDGVAYVEPWARVEKRL